MGQARKRGTYAERVAAAKARQAAHAAENARPAVPATQRTGRPLHRFPSANIVTAAALMAYATLPTSTHR